MRSVMRVVTIGLMLTGATGAVFAQSTNDTRATYSPEQGLAAFNRVRPLAEQGDAEAQWGVGILYEGGIGVPQDRSQAVVWWRKAAEQGHLAAQLSLGLLYSDGKAGSDSGATVPRDDSEALKWYRMAANQGHVAAQSMVGEIYRGGLGTPQNYAEAAKWFRKAADQGGAGAQNALGLLFNEGKGVAKDYAEAAKWYREAADQGYAQAQINLASMYFSGTGVRQDYTMAHVWANRAAATGEEIAIRFRDLVASKMTPAQIAEAQVLARSPLRSQSPDKDEAGPPESAGQSGTVFFINDSGFAVTNAHVVEGCSRMTISNNSGESLSATLIAADRQNDLALVRVGGRSKAHGQFRASPALRQGEQVVIYGYPLAGALASTGNLSTGIVTALAGLADDTATLQISAPVQPGNSGGPVVDESGLIIGVVQSKLDVLRAAESTGDIAQNVNFAIKASVLTSFLDANGVRYQATTAQQKMSTADLGDKVRGFTFGLTCTQ